jgi:hypothetical protein
LYKNLSDSVTWTTEECVIGTPVRVLNNTHSDARLHRYSHWPCSSGMQEMFAMRGGQTAFEM